MATHYTTQKKKEYSQLNYEERDIITERLLEGASVRAIARELGRAPSSILREIKRNMSPSGKYRSATANKQARERRRKVSKRSRLANPSLREEVEELLKQELSPEMVSLVLGKQYQHKVVSHETIYQYIYQDKPELTQYLIKKRDRRKHRRRKTKKKSNIPNRMPIEQRPQAANERTEFGHWEADTMVSPRGCKGVFCVMVERMTRMVLITKMKNNTADEMNRAVKRCIRRVGRKAVKTITYDNGSENAYHEVANETYYVKSYFCNPYHSWEKGSVENRIGVIRRTFPKKTDLSRVDVKDIRALECKINNYPMKCLGVRSPLEVFLLCVALQN